MTYHLKGNVLLNKDIYTPDMPYATFSEELTPVTKHEIVTELNYGSDMLKIFNELHADMRIVNVVDKIIEMEVVFQAYSYKLYELQRKHP